ncbi:MAG TPA: alpha/beta fold hydrolase [Candidatus Binataceae bacterium]|nr:alpha/beta fold hydrolase [Candidatus Binataceae bacterium]
MTTESTNGRVVSINGIELYYEIRGEGEPLLLLHGFTGAGADWDLLIGDWTNGYQLIIPDMRGHGHSANPSNQFTHRQSALDIFALLDHLKIEKFKAIGLSGGGKTLLHMATQQPARIDAMVLVSASTHFPEQARAIMNQFKVENLGDAEWAVMRQRHKHGDDQIRALYKIGNGFKDSYDDMNFSAADLGKITADTLIVYGDRDPLYPVSIALEMYAAIPRSYLWVIPNAGHVPVFLEMKDSFTRTASAFLRGDWKGK